MDFDLTGSQLAAENNLSSAKSFYEWNRDEKGWTGDETGFNMLYNSGFGDFLDWITGIRSGREQEYQTYLDNYQREYEQKNLTDARAYQEYLEGTKYQRMKSDLEAAGLNPWLALQNGVGSASVSPGSSSYSTSARKYQDFRDRKGSSAVSGIVNTALRLAMLAIAAA